MVQNAMRGGGEGRIASSRKVFENGQVFEVIEPVNLLARKTPIGGPKLPEIEAKAAEMMQKVGVLYPEVLAGEVAKMREAVSQVPAEGETAYQRIVRCCDEVRSTASTSGFGLAGEIAASLIHLIEAGERVGRRLDLCRLHVDALAALATHKLQGDGGETGRQLRGQLVVATAKYAPSA